MNIFYQLINFLKAILNWWFVVEPWEQAVRTRFGKHLRMFGPGVHIRIPFFDRIYGQNIRRRVMNMGIQTTTTLDGKCITVNGSLGYRITDVLKLHQTLHDAEGSILQEVCGKVNRYIAVHPAVECTPEKIMAAIGEALPLEKYGVGECDFFLSGYVSDIPAIRLIQEGMGGYHSAGSLSTSNSNVSGPLVGGF